MHLGDPLNHSRAPPSSNQWPRPTLIDAPNTQQHPIFPPLTNMPKYSWDAVKHAQRAPSCWGQIPTHYTALLSRYGAQASPGNLRHLSPAPVFSLFVSGPCIPFCKADFHPIGSRRWREKRSIDGVFACVLSLYSTSMKGDYRRIEGNSVGKILACVQLVTLTHHLGYTWILGWGESCQSPSVRVGFSDPYVSTAPQ